MKNKFAIFAIVTFVFLSWGLYAALVQAPTEATMGPVQRIFYYHVPCAWVMELCFPANFLLSIAYLIWRKPVIDVRLTTTLVLWLIYVSYLILRKFSIGGPNPVLAASLAIFGCLDAIFVFGAIRWFRTQHPQPVFGSGPNSGIDPRMLHAFFINMAAFTMFGILLVWLRFVLERTRQKVEEAHAMKALAGAAR